MLVVVAISDPKGRRFVERCLKERGHEVAACDTPEETRAVVARRAPAVAVLDAAALPAALPRAPRPAGSLAPAGRRTASPAPGAPREP